MFTLSLEQGYSFATMLAVAAVAIALCAAFYYRAFGLLGRWKRFVLLSLRAVAVVLIVLLLFRPVASYHKDLQERRSVVLLLDRSASMSIADDTTGVTRFNQARGWIESQWERLSADFDLHLIEFAENAHTLADASELPGLSPDGKATSVVGALLAVEKIQIEEGVPIDVDDIEAIVMLSDGVHNSAGDPLEAARQIGATVHAVGVGASLRSDATYRDVQVTAIESPDQLLLDNLAEISASVEGIGLAGRVVSAVLEEDGQPVGEPVELTLDQIEGSQRVVFEFRPTTAGRHTYTVRVPPVGGERIEQNNQRSAVAMVVEPRMRVLYVEGTLRAEYGALVQRFLSKDPDLEFCAMVQTRPSEFSVRSNIPDLELTSLPTEAEQLDMFDVFILGDLDASYLQPQQQEMILQRIRQGAGLVMLGGYHSLGPGGYGDTPLGEVLPMQLGDREVGQVTEGFLPVLTPDGRRHPIFANIAGFFPTEQAAAEIAGLPPLEGCTRVEGSRPGATVLATLPSELGTMPVLAVQPVDEGRTAVFCGDTTRRWQQVPMAMDQESPFTRFWGQMVRWLAGRDAAVEAGPGAVATTDKAYYEPREPIRIAAVVRDQQGEGAKDAEVVANITAPDGRIDQVPLSIVPGPAGHFSTTFDPHDAGKYQIEVVARLGTQALAAEPIAVEVGRPNLEFERLDLDQKTLAGIAATTGGRYVHLTTADKLIDQFDRSLRRRREFRQVRLYWPPLFWLMFVGVLTTEWVLRKRFQLR